MRPSRTHHSREDVEDDSTWTPVVLALGGNVGDVPVTLARAVEALVAVPGFRVDAVSPLVRTSPVLGAGQAPQDDYWNAVVLARTCLDPRALLAATSGIEEALGRVRHEHWGPRTVDIDIVQVAGTTRTDPMLTLPHPRARSRAFVLVPWHLVDAGAVLEGIGRVEDLAAVAPDAGGVLDAVEDWLEDPASVRADSDEYLASQRPLASPSPDAGPEVTPGAPGTSVDPGAPGSPVAPMVPGAPVAPTFPVASAAPDSDATPEEPGEDAGPEGRSPSSVLEELRPGEGDSGDVLWRQLWARWEAGIDPAGTVAPGGGSSPGGAASPDGGSSSTGAASCSGAASSGGAASPTGGPSAPSSSRTAAPTTARAEAPLASIATTTVPLLPGVGPAPAPVTTAGRTPITAERRSPVAPAVPAPAAPPGAPSDGHAWEGRTPGEDVPGLGGHPFRSPAPPAPLERAAQADREASDNGAIPAPVRRSVTRAGIERPTGGRRHAPRWVPVREGAAALEAARASTPRHTLPPLDEHPATPAPAPVFRPVSSGPAPASGPEGARPGVGPSRPHPGESRADHPSGSAHPGAPGTRAAPPSSQALPEWNFANDRTPRIVDDARDFAVSQARPPQVQPPRTTPAQDRPAQDSPAQDRPAQAGPRRSILDPGIPPHVPTGPIDHDPTTQTSIIRGLTVRPSVTGRQPVNRHTPRDQR